MLLAAFALILNVSYKQGGKLRQLSHVEKSPFTPGPVEVPYELQSKHSFNGGLRPEETLFVCRYERLTEAEHIWRDVVHIRMVRQDVLALIVAVDCQFTHKDGYQKVANVRQKVANVRPSGLTLNSWKVLS